MGRIISDSHCVARLRENSILARVRPWLARFAAGLDTDWIQEVADCTMDFLVEQAGEDRG
jgi:hypothetical protein